MLGEDVHFAGRLRSRIAVDEVRGISGSPHVSFGPPHTNASHLLLLGELMIAKAHGAWDGIADMFPLPCAFLTSPHNYPALRFRQMSR